MQTNLMTALLATREGKEADAILRSCVHCGFCSATCPTYQIQGDELDSPRGRIYQIKRVLEGGKASKNTQLHLDRCLTCLNCETTCPSGVKYNRLLDIGRQIVDEQVKRSLFERLVRLLLRKILPYSARVKPLMGVARLFRPLMPNSIKRKIPKAQKIEVVSLGSHSRKMIMLEGCVQDIMIPATNAKAKILFDKMGIEIISVKNETCCGSLSHHFSEVEETKVFMKKNIDAWWPHIESGAEALLVSASGCGKMLKEYGALLIDDSEYASKAKKVSEICRDPCEIIQAEDIAQFTKVTQKRITFHSPCTLQHGLKLGGKIESLLLAAGFDLIPVEDAHLCCGSAGTYSILQAKMSKQLLTRKLTQLEKHKPELIVTANIGCQMHLNSQSQVPVIHWLELFS